MNLQVSEALWLLLLLPLLFLLVRRKPKQDLPVGNLFLWERMATPNAKVSSRPSLGSSKKPWLTAVLMALAILAAAQPEWNPTETVPAGVIVVENHSIDPSSASRLASLASPSQPVTLLATAPQPRVIVPFTSSPEILRRGVLTLQRSAIPADIGTSLELAGKLLEPTGGTIWSTADPPLLAPDARNHTSTFHPLPIPPASNETQPEMLFGSIRVDQGDPSRIFLGLLFQNSLEEPASVHLDVRHGFHSLTNQSLSLPPQKKSWMEFPIQTPPAQHESEILARLLSMDGTNLSELRIPVPEVHPLRIVIARIVEAPAASLLRAANAIPGAQAEIVHLQHPGELTEVDADVVLVAGDFSEDSLGLIDVIDSTRSPVWVFGAAPDLTPSELPEFHPVTADLQLDPFPTPSAPADRAPHSMQPPVLPLRTLPGDHSLSASELPSGQRLLFLSFLPDQSPLPASPAFPQLIQQGIEWLAEDLHPGVTSSGFPRVIGTGTLAQADVRGVESPRLPPTFPPSVPILLGVLLLSILQWQHGRGHLRFVQKE